MHPHQSGMVSLSSGVECSSMNDDPGSLPRPTPTIQESRTSSISGGDDDLQQFCLRWHNFQSNLSHGFDALLRNETFVDVTLACSTAYPGAMIPAIKCHKVVLAACSPYFEALLRETPCEHPVIVLKDVRYEDLKPLVEFMYKGQVNVHQEQIPTLISLAEAFRIRGLAEVDHNNRVTLAPDCSRASSVTENGCGSNGRNSAHSLVKEEYSPSSPFRKRSRFDDGYRKDARYLSNLAGTSCYPTNSPGSGVIPLYQDSYDRGFSSQEGGSRSQFYRGSTGDGPGSSGASGSGGVGHEIKPAIAEMILEEERARRMEAENYGEAAGMRRMSMSENKNLMMSPWKKMNPSSGMLPGMWRKPWPPNPGQYGSANFRLRERGPVKTWTAETMAAALRAVLQNNLSLSRSARMFEIPYPTFVLYANKLHNLLGPSAIGGSSLSDVRPKGRGRPQRILLGSWPNELVEGAIRSVVFREPPENFHHLSAQWNSNFLAQNANATGYDVKREAVGSDSGPASVGGPDTQSPKEDSRPPVNPDVMLPVGGGGGGGGGGGNPACEQQGPPRSMGSDHDPNMLEMPDEMSPAQGMIDVQDNTARSPGAAMSVQPSPGCPPGYMQMKMEQGHHAVFPGMDQYGHQQDRGHEAPVYMGHAMHGQEQDVPVAMSQPGSEDLMASCLNL